MTPITELTLQPVGAHRSLLPFLSISKVQQSLTPILNGTLRRTVNGALVYTGQRNHLKYRSVIKSKDKRSPAFDGLWKGATLEVGCLQRLTLAFKDKKTVPLDRPSVTNSVAIIDLQGQAHPAPPPVKGRVTLPETFKEGFVTYRPLLIMKVSEFQQETDEWGLTMGWTLHLEEV